MKNVVTKKLPFEKEEGERLLDSASYSIGAETAVPVAVNRAVVTVAEAATDFVQGMIATDFAVTHQDDVAIDSHLAYLFGFVEFLLSDWANLACSRSIAFQEDWQLTLGAKKKKPAEGCH